MNASSVPGLPTCFQIVSVCATHVVERKSKSLNRKGVCSNMQIKHRYLSILLLASLIAIGATGCSQQAKKNRCLERANRYFQAQEYEKAQIEYMNAVRLDPHDPVAVTRLGLICFEQGRLSPAFTLLRKAEKLQPDNLEVRLKLGLTYFNLSGFKEARDESIYVVQ